MIHVKNLKKSYGPVKALDGIDFDVSDGEIVGLLGPNGAGKTTAIKILTGYLHPDAGQIQVDGLDVLAQPREVQARIGYLPENTPLYPDLSVQSYLRMMARMRGIAPEVQDTYISDAIIATGLSAHRVRPIGQLSKGLRQRVGLAQAILHKPRLLIFDEPTVGLDPTQIIEIRHLIKRLAANSTILFSSHILSEVEAVCDRVIILINGHVRADAHLDELEATSDAVLVLDEVSDSIGKRLSSLGGVEHVEGFFTHEGYPAFRIIVAESVDIFPTIYALAKDNDWPLRELRREALTLESVFTQLATTEWDHDEDDDWDEDDDDDDDEDD